MSVEIFLNLVWVGLSAALMWQWLRGKSTHGGSRCSQTLAMFLLIAILFPVISVSDDLMLAQNPAETDSLARRNEQHASATMRHAPVAASVPPQPFSALIPLVFAGAAPRQMALVAADSPVRTLIQNRPPPSA